MARVSTSTHIEIRCQQLILCVLWFEDSLKNSTCRPRNDSMRSNTPRLTTAMSSMYTGTLVMMTPNALGPRRSGLEHIKVQSVLYAKTMHIHLHPEALRHHDLVDKKVPYILPPFSTGSQWYSPPISIAAKRKVVHCARRYTIAMVAGK